MNVQSTVKDVQSTDSELGILTMTKHCLSGLLKLPKGCKVETVLPDDPRIFASDEVVFKVSGPGLTKVAEGMVIPPIGLVHVRQQDGSIKGEWII